MKSLWFQRGFVDTSGWKGGSGADAPEGSIAKRSRVRKIALWGCNASLCGVSIFLIALGWVEWTGGHTELRKPLALGAFFWGFAFLFFLTLFPLDSKKARY